MKSPAYGELFRVFGRIGLLSFGGPAAQIALMHEELVEKRPWLDEQGFLRALSFCMMLPGPEAMQLATYAGWRLRGVFGGLLAGLLFVLPGAVVIAILVGLYAAYGQLPPVQAAFLGIKAAVIVIVLQALRKVAQKALARRSSWVLAGLAFVAIFAFGLPFPLIVGLSALWGFLTVEPAPKDSPDPGEQTGWPQSLLHGFIWLCLWLVPLLALSLTGQTFLADIGWFFAKLAVVTFGGAYAVLAYMTQTVVEHHGWVTTGQMIDALGLAETTPGPLILVTQFVAMLAGQMSAGPGLAIAAGVVALWATFVPCFLWIFLAAPHLEQISRRPRLGSALSAITASVVGVILNLSVWFALHVLFSSVQIRTAGVIRMPLPDLTSLNLTAVLLTLLAALLMGPARRSLEVTLVLLALAGLATHYF
jgi:chromate transporter